MIKLDNFYHLEYSVYGLHLPSYTLNYYKNEMKTIVWRGIKYLSQDESLFFARVKSGQSGTWSLAK